MRQLQNNFTSTEQSKRLLELGVPADSADVIIESGCDIRRTIPDWTLFSKWCSNSDGVINYEDVMPCWSVGRLMEIMDICSVGEESDPNIEEYPSTIKVMNKLHISYMEYLVKSIERAVQLKIIDFSKLEE